MTIKKKLSKLLGFVFVIIMMEAMYFAIDAVKYRDIPSWNYTYKDNEDIKWMDVYKTIRTKMKLEKEEDFYLNRTELWTYWFQSNVSQSECAMNTYEGSYDLRIRIDVSEEKCDFDHVYMPLIKIKDSQTAVNIIFNKFEQKIRLGAMRDRNNIYIKAPTDFAKINLLKGKDMFQVLDGMQKINRSLGIKRERSMRFRMRDEIITSKELPFFVKEGMEYYIFDDGEFHRMLHLNGLEGKYLILEEESEKKIFIYKMA